MRILAGTYAQFLTRADDSLNSNNHEADLVVCLNACDIQRRCRLCSSNPLKDMCTAISCSHTSIGPVGPRWLSEISGKLASFPCAGAVPAALAKDRSWDRVSCDTARRQQACRSMIAVKKPLLWFESHFCVVLSSQDMRLQCKRSVAECDVVVSRCLNGPQLNSEA